jgi:hypothetical protein
MWIVRLPLRRTSTFVVMALLIGVLRRTPPAPEPTDGDDGAAEPPPPAGQPAAGSAAVPAPGMRPHLGNGAAGISDTRLTEGRS